MLENLRGTCLAGSTSYSQRGAITALSVLLVSLVVLAIAQAILYTEDRSAADALAHAAIDRAEALSNARSRVAAAAARTGHALCSNDDIEALKRISFESSFMSDVGRLDGNRLLCSALWGELSYAALPKPSYESGSVRVWKSGDLPSSPYPNSNLIAQGDTFAVASPSSFENIDPARSSRITVETRQATLTFRSIGPNLHPSIDTVEAHVCSQITNACARVIHPRRNIWSQPWPQLTAILAGAAGMGVLIASLIVHRRFCNARTIQQRLTIALQQGEIDVHYQPLRRVADGILVGYEALSRWQPPGECSIPPNVFLPIALRVGLSFELFRYVLARALAELAPLLRRNPTLHLSFNAEPDDIGHPDAVQYLSNLVRDVGLPPSQVRIEMTERKDLSCQATQANIASLVELGFRFLIDDFGTGTSNFSHLGQSPFYGVKIDRMFVAAITEESLLTPVFPGMYSIARELHLEVIAEGVESAEQDRLLRKIATDAIGQGWFYGRPAPGEVALQLAASEGFRIDAKASDIRPDLIQSPANATQREPVHEAPPSTPIQ